MFYLYNPLTRNRENFFTVLFTLVRTNFCHCQHWNDSFYQSRVTRLQAFTAQTVQELARLKCLHEFACLVPRRLSFDENVRAKEGGKGTTSVPFPWSLAVHHQSLAFRARHAKNEAPEEEAASLPKRGTLTCNVPCKHITQVVLTGSLPFKNLYDSAGL